MDQDMLGRAFIDTHDYRALTVTRDFNFIVGRRGTGKTALFLKCKEHFSTEQASYLHSCRSEEHLSMELDARLGYVAPDYRMARALARVGWRLALLMEAVNNLAGHWKLQRTDEAEAIRGFSLKHQQLLSQPLVPRLLQILRSLPAKSSSNEAPGFLATEYSLAELEASVKEALSSLNRTVVFLFDGLDEGWVPSETSTGIIGGLAIALADFRDKEVGIHGLLFIRDNVFRALASLDNDFSRHIEGGTLRLHWDEEALLNLVATRLRICLELDRVENNIKVWNRFAKRGIEGRAGFRFCLQQTLYRPRDIIVLLNQAFHVAARGGRKEITDGDVTATARHLSQDRLSDLKKEYESVFPGLPLFVNLFVGTRVCYSYSEAVDLLEDARRAETYEDPRASDFGVLGTGQQIFHALYSVGFFGIKNKATDSVTFCHDGSRGDPKDLAPTDEVLIHPCYWKALEIDEKGVHEEWVLEIHDEYQAKPTPEATDMRLRMLGRLIADLPTMSTGPDGAREFEDWVFRAVQILFAGQLKNVALHPVEDTVQRRDIVGTNMASEGFWRRVLEDYCSRQVVIEVKNYEELKLEDYRQVLSYSGKEYGKFALIVSRRNSEGVGKKERAWIQEMYSRHDLLVLHVPSMVLARCIKKLRNPDRKDYTDRILNKLMDTYLRSYVSVKSG